MMGGAGRWIVGIISLSLAISLGEELVSQRGIRRVWNLAGGILLMLAILSPMADLGWREWEESAAGYARAVAQREADLAAAAEADTARGIAEQLEAYICDKAAALGLEGTVRITLSGREEGYLPVGAELAMPFHPQLSGYLADELGIEREHQRWQEEIDGNRWEAE